jgi:xylulokinase
MYFLVINLGLKSIRAIVFDKNGRKIVQQSLPINTTIKGSYQVEQNPVEWWNQAVTVARKVCVDESLNRQIRFITVTGSAACLVTLDECNEPVYNALMVSDKRATAESDEIERSTEFEAMKASFGYEINPYYMLPKLLWLKNNKRKAFSRIRSVTTPNGFLLSRITGRNVVDLFDAEKFYYSPEQGYPTALIQSIGLSRIAFPDVKKHSEQIGPITEEAQKALGLTSEVTAVLSSYDAICAFYGCGALDIGECCDVSGTVTSVRVMCNRLDLKRRLRGIFVQSAEDDRCIVGGSNNLGGGVAEWLRQGLYAGDTNPYELMEAEGNRSSVGARGLLFLPYLMGERAPIWNDNARGVFFGVERNHTRADFTRAVFEGIGFSVKSIIDLIEKSGVPVKHVRVSGGLAQIHCINRIKSDILNRQVLVLEEIETTSLGALMMMTVSAGIYKTLQEAASHVVRIREAIFPSPENHAKYNSLNDLSNELYNALVPIFDRRLEVYSTLWDNLAEEITNL